MLSFVGLLTCGFIQKAEKWLDNGGLYGSKYKFSGDCPLYVPWPASTEPPRLVRFVWTEKQQPLNVNHVWQLSLNWGLKTFLTSTSATQCLTQLEKKKPRVQETCEKAAICNKTWLRKSNSAIKSFLIEDKSFCKHFALGDLKAEAES